MKPVIIIGIAFVLLIPISVFAQIIDFTSDEEIYYQFSTITFSGVVDVNPDIPEISIEYFNPEKKFTGSFTRDINPDGTFIFTLQANPDVYTIDGEYTFKITYVNSIEKTINYQKFRDIAPFVDQSKNPCSYVDRYNNEPAYEKWFRDNYPEYIGIHEAVGIHDKREMCEPEMSEAETQAREEIPNPCINIREPKVATEYQGDIGLNNPAYMEAVREAQSQYMNQLQHCMNNYNKLVEQRVAELECGDFEFKEFTPVKDYDLLYDLILAGLHEQTQKTGSILVDNYKGTVPYESECQSFFKEWRQLGKENERWNESCPNSGLNPNAQKQGHMLDLFKVCGFASYSTLEPSSQEAETLCGTGTIEKNGLCVLDSTTKGGGCLIATATFGSELTPQVQMLREIRDNSLLQTQSGQSFMQGFNSLYYSFSPTIADYERENPAFKETVKLTITPLMASLSLLNYVDLDSEESVLGYGIGIILMNVGMYFVAPVMVIHRIKKILNS